MDKIEEPRYDVKAECRDCSVNLRRWDGAAKDGGAEGTRCGVGKWACALS